MSHVIRMKIKGFGRKNPCQSAGHQVPMRRLCPLSKKMFSSLLKIIGTALLGHPYSELLPTLRTTKLQLDKAALTVINLQFLRFCCVPIDSAISAYHVKAHRQWSWSLGRKCLSERVSTLCQRVFLMPRSTRFFMFGRLRLHLHLPSS